MLETYRLHSAHDISPRARLSSISSSVVSFLAGFRGSAGIFKKLLLKKKPPMLGTITMTMRRGKEGV